MTKTHEQKPERPLDRTSLKRGADLCRRNPALWSRMVRYSDALQAEGVDRDVTSDTAMVWAEQIERPGGAS